MPIILATWLKLGGSALAKFLQNPTSQPIARNSGMHLSSQTTWQVKQEGEVEKIGVLGHPRGKNNQDPILTENR
jgi:hypothetical protein